MNRNDMATAMRRYLNELGTDYIGTTFSYDALNAAGRRINREARANRADMTMSIKSGAREYTMSGSIIEVYDVRLGTGTDRVQLDPATRAALKRDDDNWEADVAGVPTQYYTDGMVIGFDPLPTAYNKWTTAHAYAVGAYVIPSASDNGFVYKCITAGTSAASEPTWPTTIDGTIGEGAGRTPLWQQDRSTRVFMRVCKSVNNLANGTSTPTWYPTEYHDIQPKLAAIEVSGGYSAERASSNPRLEILYREYLADRDEVKALAKTRSAEVKPRINPTGYGKHFRRL